LKEDKRMSISIVPIDAFAFQIGYVTRFNVPGYKPGVLVVTGTAYSNAGHVATNGALIGFVVNLNEVAIGSCQVWANNPEVHMTVPTFFASVALQPGQNAIKIQALNSNTVFDINDQFQIYFME
jgi:hypothetical protein